MRHCVFAIGGFSTSVFQQRCYQGQQLPPQATLSFAGVRPPTINYSTLRATCDNPLVEETRVFPMPLNQQRHIISRCQSRREAGPGC